VRKQKETEKKTPAQNNEATKISYLKKNEPNMAHWEKNSPGES